MPTENRVRTYTVAELERLATEYLAQHFGPDVLIPVDVDLLVEKAEGITLDVWPKLQANHKVLGMVLRDVGSGELFIYSLSTLTRTSPITTLRTVWPATE